MRLLSCRCCVAGSSPSTLTMPDVGRRYPSHTSIVDVLPAPFGPSTVVTSPAAAANEMASTATTVAMANRQMFDLHRSHSVRP